MLNAKYLLKCHTESRLRGHRSQGRCYFRVGRNTLGQSCPSLSLSKELGHVGPRRRTVRSIATFHFLRQSEVCVGPPKGIWGVTVPGPVLRFRPLVLRFRPLLLPFRGPRYGSKAPPPPPPPPPPLPSAPATNCLEIQRKASKLRSRRGPESALPPLCRRDVHTAILRGTR